MLRRVVLLGCLAACGKSKTTPDEKLGGLVIATKKADAPIDVTKAGRDPGELGRALAQPYAKVVAALPSHTATIDTKLRVTEGPRLERELTDHTVIELGQAPAFHATYSNSADYGREVIFTGGKLYLRPRYQRWHGRAPESPEEPETVRDSFYSALAATWNLLAPGIELTDKGPVQVAGRAGRKIEIRKTPTAKAPPKETVKQRAWRETRVVEAVAGEIVLDTEKGVPLAWKLDGAITYLKDGRRFTMQVGLAGGIADVGRVAAIAAPPEGEVVATPGRMREVEERDQLLEGIAPPQKAGATPPMDDDKPATSKPPAADKPADDKDK